MSEKNNILDNDGFLGKGWNFPPTLTENGVKMVSYEEDIQQSLYVLLSTSPSERVNRYDYGCPLRKYAFEVMDTEMVTQMRNDITRAVMLFEPRITLEEVSFEKHSGSRHSHCSSLAYFARTIRLPGTYTTM